MADPEPKLFTKSEVAALLRAAHAENSGRPAISPPPEPPRSFNWVRGDAPTTSRRADPDFAVDIVSIVARDPLATDAAVRAVCLMVAILHRSDWLGPPLPSARRIAAEKFISMCPREPSFLKTIARSPKGNDAPDRVDMSAIAAGVAAYQDRHGAREAAARADAVAAGVADGSVVPIDRDATAKFILASRDKALGKESKP